MRSHRSYVRSRARIGKDGNQVNTEEIRRMRERILKRDKQTCQNCRITVDSNAYTLLQNDPQRKKLLGNYPTLDHIIPVADGGLFSEDNLRLLCNDCNLNFADMYRYYIVCGYRSILIERKRNGTNN